MAKWNSALPGCSGHMHQSLWTKNGNAFDDDKDPRRMSKVFKSYLAGQLRCLPDLLPFFAPTVNSYKRLVDGYWAPTKVTWGIDNRTVAFRVIPGGPKSTRVEVRVTGSDINPYLALAASIGAGLWGIDPGAEARGRARRGQRLHGGEGACACRARCRRRRGGSPSRSWPARSSARSSWTTTCARASGSGGSSRTR